MLDELPFNKTAPVVNNLEPNKLSVGELPTTALGLQVKNKLKREGKI
jgi:hypothetical protein